MLKKIIINFSIFCLFIFYACSNNTDNKIESIVEPRNQSQYKESREYLNFFVIFDTVLGLNFDDVVILDNEQAGYVKNIELFENKVKLEISIIKNVEVFEGAEITIYKTDDKKNAVLIKQPRIKEKTLRNADITHGKNSIIAEEDQLSEFIF